MPSTRLIQPTYDVVCALTDTPIIDLPFLLSLVRFKFEFSFVFQVVIMFMVPCMSAGRADMKGKSRFLNQFPNREVNGAALQRKTGPSGEGKIDS